MNFKIFQINVLYNAFFKSVLFEHAGIMYMYSRLESDPSEPLEPQ
jgi:hypothetical protein